MRTTSPYQCRFIELPNLFSQKTPVLSLLNPSFGKGSVKFFHLARGLDARVWDCTFFDTVILQGESNTQIRNRHFTLLFFLDNRAFSILRSDTFLHKNISWNTAFISADCNCQMQISPAVNSRCLSVSFSESWCKQNLLWNEMPTVSLNLTQSQSFSLIGSMKTTELKVVEELMNASWKQSFGTFYIKSRILRLVSDVLYRIRQRETFTVNQQCRERRIPEIDAYIR